VTTALLRTLVADDTANQGDPMAGLIQKSFDSPEETRSFEQGSGKLELVNLEGGAVGRATFQPGWQWSKHIKPIAGTASCMTAHTGYFISGRMKVAMDDGQEAEFGPGDFMVCPQGHEDWIVCDEPFVVIEVQVMADYEKRTRPNRSAYRLGATAGPPSRWAATVDRRRRPRHDGPAVP
jgi:quercetin dioxygenase-like cupin family protein